MNGIGDIFVLSAPSGTGKSTLIRRLLGELDSLAFSVSYTTRPPRTGEIDGRDYFFTDNATFDTMIAQGGFVEWVQVYQHRYGTGRAWIQDKINSGQDVLLDLETAGAMRVKEMFPNAILIFLMPPSAQVLADRLKGRGVDTEEQISIRLQYAKHEMERWNNYNYLVLNDNLETAYKGFKSIFLATRLSRARLSHLASMSLGTFVV